MFFFPNTLRVVLLILTTVSFIPQLTRILSRRDCNALAPNYLLINLIVATEHFAFYLHFILDWGSIDDFMVGSPPSLGDYLNLAQFSVVALYHFTTFALYLYYSPSRLKAYMVSMYTAFLLISIAPIILESTLPPTHTGGDMKDRTLLSAAYAVFHAYFIHPAVTLAAVCALGAQVHELRDSLDVGALSMNGLALQAGTFALVAVGWALRLRLPFDQQPVYNWYPLVGWAPVDSFVFAAVQGTLWWWARRQFGLFGQVVEEHSHLFKTYRFCFFLDGLDEYDEPDRDYFHLITLLRQWTERAPDDLKICASSRELNPFNFAFSSNQRLRLQDLKKHDIEHVVRNELKPFDLDPCLLNADLRRLVSEIVSKAEGVFLWVTLVLRAVRQGISDGDNISQLRNAVNELPSELEDLFQRLLDTIPKTKRREAALTLSVVSWLDSTRYPFIGLPLLWYYYLDAFSANQSFATELTFLETGLDAKGILDLEERSRRKVYGYCKGLVEVVEQGTQEFYPETNPCTPDPSFSSNSSYGAPIIRDSKPKYPERISESTVGFGWIPESDLSIWESASDSDFDSRLEVGSETSGVPQGTAFQSDSFNIPTQPGRKGGLFGFAKYDEQEKEIDTRPPFYTTTLACTHRSIFEFLQSSRFIQEAKGDIQSHELGLLLSQCFVAHLNCASAEEVLMDLRSIGPTPHNSFSLLRLIGQLLWDRPGLLVQDLTTIYLLLQRRLPSGEVTEWLMSNLTNYVCFQDNRRFAYFDLLERNFAINPNVIIGSCSMAIGLFPRVLHIVDQEPTIWATESARQCLSMALFSGILERHSDNPSTSLRGVRELFISHSVGPHELGPSPKRALPTFWERWINRLLSGPLDVEESTFWFEVVLLALEYGADPEFYVCLEIISRAQRIQREPQTPFLTCRWKVDDNSPILRICEEDWKEMSDFIEANGGRVPFRHMAAEFWKPPNCDAILDLIDKYPNNRPGQTTNDVLKDAKVVHSPSVGASGNDIVLDQEARENRVEQVSPSADNSEGTTVERPNLVAQIDTTITDERHLV